MTESAIVDENIQPEEDLQEDVQTEVNDYDIEEPQDDFEFDDDGTNSITVPQVDNEEDAEDGKTQKPEDKKEDKQVEADKKTEKVEKTEPVKEAEPEKISDVLIEKAKSLGLKDEDIAAFTTSKQLETICDLIEPTAEKNVVPQTNSQQVKTEAEKGLKVDLDRDLYDPALCDAIEGTVNQVNTIKSTLNAVVNSLQTQSQRNFVENFDRMVNSLGPNFNEVLGKGDFTQIENGSDFYNNRCKILDEMNTLAAGLMGTGKKMPSQKQLFDRAVNAVFGDKIKSSVRKEISDQLKDRSTQMIARPTVRNGKTAATPDQRAQMVVRDKLREFGAYDDEAAEDF